jgi:hypothetical protein
MQCLAFFKITDALKFFISESLYPGCILSVGSECVFMPEPSRSLRHSKQAWVTRERLTLRRKRGRSPVVLLLLVLLWSICMGFGFAWAAELPDRADPLFPAKATPFAPSNTIAQATGTIGTVDVVPPKHQLGQDLYLENCASCHVGVPPEVLPTATWLQLIQDSQHYGQQLKPLLDPTRLLVWNYLRSFSRPYLESETTPYRVADSRFFKAFHPKIKFSTKPKLEGCITCHIGAQQYDYRSLAPKWQIDP